MKASFQKHFEEGLQAISDSLIKKRGHKGYSRVMERLGRLRERHPIIAQFYNVEVTVLAAPTSMKGKLGRTSLH